MKKLILLLLFVPLIGTAQEQEAFQSDLDTEKKPWTNLDFANDPRDFQFAIVTDRTGSPRKGVFEDAIEKLNWLMPEFVISVGDLIRGASGKDSVKLDKQWAGHFERIAPLKVPFFHLAGNHDIKANNEFQVDYWNKLFGTPYYSFVYKEVLFLCLFSNQGTQVLTEEQVAYFKEVIERNSEVRWTMVFLHHPLWRYPHMSNFGKIEDLLSERDYTVFAGHQHQYHHSVQNESNYYVLATTGGGSPLLGNSFGSFDHITWVTMSDEGPILANLRLDGILPHDVSNDETHELTKRLLRAVNVQTEVFVDSERAFAKGKAFITYKNTSAETLKLNGRFFHNHHVTPKPGVISLEIPANSVKTLEVDLTSNAPFNLKQKVQLEFQGTIGYELDEYPDLQLTGNVVIPVQRSSYDLLGTKNVEFVESYRVRMKPAIQGTTIRYTLNGKDPEFTSLNYNGPFEITESTEVRAGLFTDDGKMMSEIMKMEAKSIKPGKGLMVAYYPFGEEARSLGGLPDLEGWNPLWVKPTEALDPVKIADKKDQFGLVYKGAITVNESGNYQFKVISDDGIRILLDGKEVVSDPIKHKAREASGEIHLSKGKHAIEIQYFQWKRNYALDIDFITPGGERQDLTSEILSYDKNALNDGM